MATRSQAISTTISKSNLNSRQLVYSCIVWVLTVCMMALFCQSALGQSNTKAFDVVDEKWRVVPLHLGATAREQAEHRKEYKQAANEIRAAKKRVRETLVGGGNVSELTPFFLGHVYPMMTVQDDSIASTLGQRRAEYIKDYLGPKVTGKSRSDMIKLTLNNMQKIYSNKSNGAAHRLSAVYLMGILDEVPAVRLEGQPPVPSKAALVGLAKVLFSKDQPEFLKVAAIAGIQRHLEVDNLVGGGQIPNDQKRALNQKALALLNAKETTPVAYWLKRRSMQIIGLIGLPASTDAAIAILESDASMWLKLDAVEALGRIQTRSLGAKPSLAAALAISDFVTQAIGDESKAIQSTVDEIVFNGILQQNIDLLAKPVDYQAQAGNQGSTQRNGGGFGGIGGGAEPEEPQFELPGYHLNLTRRRIKSLAYICSQTLGGDTGELGLRQNTAGPEKALIGNIIDELERLLVESNVGIIDLEEEPSREFDQGEKSGTATHQLTELCKDSARQMAQHLRKHRGQPDPNAPGSGTTNPPGSPPGSDTTNPPPAGPPGSDTTNPPPGAAPASGPPGSDTTNPVGQ